MFVSMMFSGNGMLQSRAPGQPWPGVPKAAQVSNAERSHDN